MKIMVTGGAGFIGSHVVDMLIDAGHEVVVVDNLSTGKIENVNEKAIFYGMDIRSPDIEQIFDKERPEVIDHHAAQMDVRRSIADPILDAEVNILGAINLAQLAIKYGVRKFIHISSGGAVYGEPVYLPCDENHPITPLCPYGLTKYAFEKYLHIFKINDGLDYSVLRYPNVYGPRQDPHGEAGVVAIFAEQMLNGERVTINGNGDQVRDFVYVSDCARANLMLLDNGSGQVFNLGWGIGRSINDIYARLWRIVGYNQEVQYGAPKKGETFRIYLDASKAERELKWKPEVELDEGLMLTTEYIRNHRSDIWHQHN